MTSIVVDPHELTAVATTLRSVARETAAVGSGLAHCTQCAMPPEIETQVTDFLSACDRVLDDLARQMEVSTNDLLKRALVATLDSLAAATAASGSGLATFAMAPFGGSVSSTDFRTFGLPAGMQVAPAPASPLSSDFRTFGLPAGADPADFRRPPAVGLPSVAGARISHNALVYATNGTEMLRPMYTQLGRTQAITHAIQSPLTTTVRRGG